MILFQIRFWVSKVAATEPSTSDGLTVQKFLASNWNILDENDDDWKSHIAAVAQSINLIKHNLQVTTLFSLELNMFLLSLLTNLLSS